MFAIDQYLLPKLSELEILTKEFELIKIKKKDRQYKANKIIDDFIRVYSLFYSPSSKKNNPRKAWGLDYDHVNFFKRFGGYAFKKNNLNKVEANNLRVSEHDQVMINNCLKLKVSVGQFLSSEQITLLKRSSLEDDG